MLAACELPERGRRPRVPGVGVMDLDLRLLRYFVAVADELHFGRAAAKLYLSQPALSKPIRKLEDQLGAPLLVRDSRHVTLTTRGHRLLEDARQLLALAERMQYESSPNVVRIAHIFELQTSRRVADAYTSARPDVSLVERQLTSVAQLRALLDNRLDVAILRVTAQMKADHPTGWQHRLLRLEPMLLVGRPGDRARETISLYERPVEVFADAPESGLYNAHGTYMTAFEQHTGLAMRWLGNPGPFGHCLAVVDRATTAALVLDFESYAVKYAAHGLPVHRPAEIQPYFPWSLAWRDEKLSQPIADLLDVATATAAGLQWHQPMQPIAAPVWMPPDDPDALGLL
jgi:DNA-binding transcriptional LysR family regulator